MGNSPFRPERSSILQSHSLEVSTSTMENVTTSSSDLIAPTMASNSTGTLSIGHSGDTNQSICFRDLITVLFECFLIISLGYLSCRFKLISNQAKDLNSYITTFALPMIIFLNIAQMEFRTINLSFLICMLVAKLVIFLVVTLLTITVSYPTNLSYAGALSILATQSNDFALGYPLIKSLYGKNNPEMLSYLGLMAPIQLLILNPLGIMMLEYHKFRQTRGTSVQDSRVRGRDRVESRINLGFLKALATNPLIIASVVAFLVNISNGPQLPKFVTRVSNTMAASFASPALFVIGISIYGKFELLLRNPSDLLLSTVLVLTKVLILPSVARMLALIILPSYSEPEELSRLIDFAFLYGLLPTAPTACIIANQYGVLTNVVSISMILSTFASAPLMLGASSIINPAMTVNEAYIDKILSIVIKSTSFLSLVGLTFLAAAIWRLKARGAQYGSFTNLPRGLLVRIKWLKSSSSGALVILLVASQSLIMLGGLLWFFEDSYRPSADSTSIGDYAPREPIVEIASTGKIVIDNEIHDAHDQLAEGLTFKLLSKIQHIMTSSGLIMSRFVVLCLVISVANKTIKSCTFFRTTTLSIALKAYIALSICSVTWLIFDAQELKYKPGEASLPNSQNSLYVRLIYSVTFLALTIPLFAMVLREVNKKNLRMKKTASNANITGSPAMNDLPGLFSKRRFLTSNGSLSSSDSGSAMTTHTNLDITNSGHSLGSGSLPSAPSSDEYSVIIKDNNNNNHNHNNLHHHHHHHHQNTNNNNDSFSKTSSKIIMHVPTQENILDSRNITGRYGATNLTDEQQRAISVISPYSHHDLNDQMLGRSINQTIQDSTLDDSTISSEINLPHIFSLSSMDKWEFSRHSIVIVFMLINVTFNTTSIAQKLLQYQTYNTFCQVSIMSTVLEFGQSLVTLLSYGLPSCAINDNRLSPVVRVNSNF